MATYPGGIPSLTDPSSTDFLNDYSHSTLHREVNDEIEALATELGTSPSGAYANVTARLDAVDASLAGKTTVVAGPNNNFVMFTGGNLVDSGSQATDFAAASHTTSSDHDSRYYTEVETDAFLGAKMDLVGGATLNNFASFNASGQVIDSTYGSSSFDAAGTAAAAVAAHAATSTSSIEHNPYVVGSKTIDETDIADNKILYFHFPSNQIRYGDANAIQQEDVEDWVAALIQDGTGPLVWTYDDGAGTLTGNLPQGIDTTDTPQFTSVNVNGNYSLPSVDGLNGYVMTTNGSGTVTWQAASAAADVENSSIRHVPYLLGGM